MTEDEVEVVAEALARAAGMTWHAGRETATPPRIVLDRYRDRARTAIATVDRLRRARTSCLQDNAAAGRMGEAPPDPSVIPGAVVYYSPDGDRRDYACRVVKIEGSRAYLQPIIKACTGWISIERVSAPVPDPVPEAAPGAE